jgi:hypothetical protein
MPQPSQPLFINRSSNPLTHSHVTHIYHFLPRALLALPQVSARLYLVRHQLPADLPPPTPLTPCAPIDEATVTLAHLPTLLPSLLPGPSYPPLPPTAAAAAATAAAAAAAAAEEEKEKEKEKEDKSAASTPAVSRSPPPTTEDSDPHDPHHPSQQQHIIKTKKKRERGRSKKHHARALQEALLLRGGSEADVATVGVGSGVTGGSPSSLRALLQSPYPDDPSTPPVATAATTGAGAGAGEAPASISPGGGRRQQRDRKASPALEKAEEQSVPHADAHTQARRSRRPPSLPTARLNSLRIGTAAEGGEPGSEMQMPAVVAVAAMVGAASAAVEAATAAVAAAAEAEADAQAPWERVPTPTSFAVPLPSPSPASPYQLPPALMLLSPDCHAPPVLGAAAPPQQQQQQRQQPRERKAGGAVAGVISFEEGKESVA